MLQNKIQEALSLLHRLHNVENRDAIESRLRCIEKQMSDPDAMFSMDASVLKEVSDIVENLNQNSRIIIEPPKNMPVNLLKQILTTQVQSLCRLPVPLPQNFDKQSYQTFVNQDSRKWMEKINQEQKEPMLLDMFDEIYNTSFLIPEVQQEYDELQKRVTTILDTKCGLSSTDVRLLNLIKLKVQSRNIQQAAVASVIDHYMSSYGEAAPAMDVVELSAKDTKILFHVVENHDIFIDVAKVIGLSHDEAEAVYKILSLDKEKEQLLSKLKRVIKLSPVS